MLSSFISLPTDSPCPGFARIRIYWSPQATPIDGRSLFAVALSSTRRLLFPIASDLSGESSIGQVSMRFHRALAALLADAAEDIRRETGCGCVALSGGCFQNELLLKLGVAALERRGGEGLDHVAGSEHQLVLAVALIVVR